MTDPAAIPPCRIDAPQADLDDLRRPVTTQVVRELHALLESRVTELTEAASWSTVAAYLACLEAVHDLGRVVLEGAAGAGDETRGALHEAWAAMQAASVAIRFSIVEQGDRARLCQSGAANRAGPPDQHHRG